MTGRALLNNGRLVGVVLLVASLAACEQMTPVDPSAVTAGGLAARKDGNQCSLGFRVTTDDGAGKKLRSDGNGAYVDGVDKVMAFTGSGPGFRLDTNSSQRIEGAGGIRTLVIDFTGVLSEPPAPFGTAGKGVDLRFYLNDGGLDLCALSSPGASGTVGLTVLFEVNGNPMTLTYGTALSQSDSTLVGERVVVTRTSVSPDTWTIVGQNAGLRNGYQYGPVVPGAGSLAMPFTLTLVRK